MTFIGYDMGAKAYRFMHKDNSMVIAVKCLFDEDTFPRAKSKNGTSNQNKLKISPPGNIEEDLEEIYILPNPNTNDIDHNHDDPHDNNSSDHTCSESQESPPSEEESSESEERKGFKSMESEDSVPKKNWNNLPLMKNQKKKKSRMNFNQKKKNPLTKKNLLHLTLEEVVLFPPMKNPEKEVITAMKPHLNQRVKMTHLNQEMKNVLVHHSLGVQQENNAPLLNTEVRMVINQPLKSKKI